jgi:hypothetical protein
MAWAQEVRRSSGGATLASTPLKTSVRERFFAIFDHDALIVADHYRRAMLNGHS